MIVAAPPVGCPNSRIRRLKVVQLIARISEQWRQLAKKRLLVFSRELSDCSFFQVALGTEFNAELAATPEQFLRKVKTSCPEAAVFCFCSAREQDAEELHRLGALAGPLPVIACSRSLTLDFVREAARGGVNHFVCCKWEKAKITAVTLEAIEHGGIRQFLQVSYLRSRAISPHVPKMVNAIVRAFPHRLREFELAERLGMSHRWLRTLCRQGFDKTFTQLVRRIWIYQALRMMQHTNLDNTEIALRLNYSEEGSMARDFRKELGYSCNEARKRLANQTPEELLK